ncbi:hypothetical protein CDIK_0258 [Cucumispora dikerogammari]|nr:hypothetical protein CDIK_0258 [Cucumispora dikerogammari]
MLLLKFNFFNSQVLCAASVNNMAQQGQNKNDFVKEKKISCENESFFSASSEILMQIKTDFSKNIEQKIWQLSRTFYDSRISYPHESFFVQTKELIQEIEHLRDALAVFNEFIKLEKTCMGVYSVIKDAEETDKTNYWWARAEREKINKYINHVAIFVTSQNVIKSLNENVIHSLKVWELYNRQALLRIYYEIGSVGPLAPRAE